MNKSQRALGLLATATLALSLAACSNTDSGTDALSSVQKQAACLRAMAFGANIDAYSATQEAAPVNLDAAAFEQLVSELPEGDTATLNSNGEITVISQSGPATTIILSDEVGGTSAIPGC